MSSVTVVRDEADKKGDEAEARRKLLRQKMLAGDYSGRPTDTINPTPGFRYKGINRKRTEQARAKLFEPVPPEDPANFLGAMGKEKTYGDLVLMREPMDVYQAKVRRSEQRFASKHADKQEEILDELNRVARNGKAVGAHRKAVIDVDEED
jgi:hypothetical protein